MKTINTKNTVTPVYQKSRGAKTFDILHSLRLILSFALFGMLFLTAANLNANAQAAGSVDPAFTGGVSRSAISPYAILIQPDGKHLIGGSSLAVNGRGRNLVARLQPDGNLDESFVTDSRYNGQVFAMALQSDGKIIIGGGIIIPINPNGTNNRRGIARLNADGTLDAAFSTNGGVVGNVNSIIIQPDGKILIGGRFDSVDGVARRGVARLNIDGSLDTTFDPGTGITVGSSYYVNTIALQQNGQVLIGGLFTEFNGTPINNIARLNSNGTFDATFNVGTGTNQDILTIALQADGKIIIGGFFNTYNNVTAFNIARINTDGTRDTSFLEGNGSTCPQPPCANRNVNVPQQITVLSDGKIYVSSRGFSNPNVGVGGLLNTIVRLNSNGSLDGTFNAPFISLQFAPLYLEPSRHAIQADGKVVTNLPRGTIIGGQALSTYIARYNSNGSFDSTYTPILLRNGFVYDVVIQPDGKVIAVGGFSAVNNAYYGSIARFNIDGTRDANFNAVITGDARKVTLQPDGKILVAGIFSQVNGVSRGGIARLNSDGTLDTGFATNPGVDIFVDALALQADGKILIGGNFTTYNGTSRNGIARLNADGSLDTTFNPGSGFDDQCSPCKGVQSIDIQPNGKIMVGGNFRNFNGIPRVRVARLNTDGTLDTTFNPGAGVVEGQIVNKVKILSNGKILITGNFSQYNNIAVNRIARLNADGSLDNTFSNTAQPDSVVTELYVQSNDKIIISGLFSTIAGQFRRSVARLNSNGTLDNSFGANSIGAFSNDGQGDGNTALAVDEAGGKIYFGGFFSTFNNIGRGSLVRLFLGPTQTVRTPFDFDGDSKSDISVFRPSNGAWYLNQSTAGFTGITFGNSTDLPAPADFDGDGKTDVAVFRPSNGAWYYLRSSDGAFVGVTFGQNGDLPRPADFDGDGKADINVFRPSNGAWYRLNSSNGSFSGAIFGQNGDKPLIADFDGDGKSDIAVFRPSNGTFYWLNSSTGGFAASAFGLGTDIPTMGDFDGDGKTDIAVFRPSNGAWYRFNSSNGAFVGVGFGQNGDIPVTADYDGDGKSDIAVFRPSTGAWYYLNSTNGEFVGLGFGFGTDKPIPASF